MKKTFYLLLILCTACSMHAIAQNSQGNSISMSTYLAKATQETNFMRDSLGLSEGQVLQVDSLNKKHFKSIAELELQQLTVSQRKEEMNELLLQRDIDLQAVLTQAQFARFKEVKRALEARMRARMGIQ